MYFQSFYLTCLAHASYMVGSDGIAAVVDPQRDVDIYIEDAKQQGLKIAYVIETHLHADFVSGHHELAERTGATICMSAKAGATFPHRDIHDGDKIDFGKCVLQFLETPGHTPESICILVTDRERANDPWAVLTGDTLFIGDVGRPDLSADHTLNNSRECFTTVCTTNFSSWLTTWKFFPRMARVRSADAASEKSAARPSEKKSNLITHCKR